MLHESIVYIVKSLINLLLALKSLEPELFLRNFKENYDCLIKISIASSWHMEKAMKFPTLIIASAVFL
jgi:hypothetical protein